MSRATVLAIAAVVAAACACGARRDDAATTPAAPAAVEPATTPADPATVPAAPAPSAPAQPPALPAVALACASDADCAFTDIRLTGPELCCQGCDTHTAGRVDWVAQVRAACDARPDWTARCLPLNCPVAPLRIACKARQCMVVP